MPDDGKVYEIGERSVKPAKGKPVDFIDLWLGVPEDEVRKAGWQGGFSGRLELADMLWPAIRSSYRGKARSSVKVYLGYLRAFSRFLDAYEAWTSSSVQFYDCNEALGLIWQQPPHPDAWEPPRGDMLARVGAILRLAHRHAGTDKKFHWPVSRKNIPEGKDVANAAQAKAALNVLKREAQAIYARWKRADQLAATGRNLLDSPRGRRNPLGFRPTEADFHATYRAFILTTGDPLPSAAALYAVLGRGSAKPRFWKVDHFDLQAGLYPTLADLCCLSQLFMARSGWNPSTTYSLDIGSSDWAVRLPGELDLYRIESFKQRSRTWQDTVCRGRLTTGPYHIVCALLERTAPLRALIESDAARLSAGIVQEARRSPWLAAGEAAASGSVSSLATDASKGAPSTWWRAKVNEHNRDVADWNIRVDPENRRRLQAQKGQVGEGHALALLARKVEIPLDMTPSDWRDIYAGFVFVDSGYSWLLTQWALGHKHLASTRHYLRSRLWRRFSEEKLRQAQVALLDQLATGELDLALLRCKLDLGVEPTAEDRARLTAFRDQVKRDEITPCGYHCGSPMAPPPEMDPGNPGDGTMRARCGAHCPGCPQGFAVDADYMVKTLVGLRWRRRGMSAAAWDESQYAAEIDMLEYDLRQWPKDEVAARIAHWDAEFAAGREQSIGSAGLN